MRPVRSVLAFAAALLLVGADSPEPAAIPTAGQLAAMSMEELGRRTDAMRDRETTPQFWCELAAYVGEASRRRPDKEINGVAAIAAGFCARGQEKYSDALGHWARAEKILGNDGQPDQRIEIEALLLHSAVMGRDKAAFAEHLAHVAKRGWPDEYRKANFELWRYGLQMIGPEAAGPIALTFARSGAFYSLPDDLRATIGWWAVKPAIAAGDVDLAGRMATLVPDPLSAKNMLIDRDFALIWPMLEAAAGPRFKSIREAAVTEARQRSEADPDNGERRSDLIIALANNGTPALGLAVAAKTDHMPDAELRWSESDGWVINAEVRALDSLGRRAEADRLMDRLGTLSPDDQRGWVVSFAINRSTRLVSQGRWAEALPAAELAIKVAADHGNPYSQQLAAYARFCAAANLNPRNPDLAGWWTAIEANWSEGVEVAVGAALCKGDRTAAERIIRLGLANPDTRAFVLSMLQPAGFSFDRPDPNGPPDPRILLDGNPNLRALFLKYGRDLPAKLMPN